MPCNAYGINDNYDLNTSHFLPAMIKKTIYAAKNKKRLHDNLGQWKTFKGSYIK